ncbi:Uncharacterised protein [Serratia quinivorans]|jgi:hypothetical protein|uniref:Uncharacterized protein n=1 Tax=Serratia proteamaculans TaxID=28151 RepID=A0ABS0TYK7_SERPR|nr:MULTISPECIES: hypothetical protein [Serratia]MBI6183459.1 hypothetical protein [Serratia proteamaculans]CAI1512278.1 Uncharacterised protein [Serratia quinivorans]
MADITVVGNALVQLVAEVCRSLSPDHPVKVYQGWPTPGQLKEDLLAGAVHISVFPRPGSKVTSVLSGEGEWEESVNDGVRGSITREVRRETRQYQVTVWASCFDRRDPLANAIDPELSAVSRITLGDGSQATIAYISSLQDDDNQKIGVYRRDFFYAVNYGVYQTQSAWAIKQIKADYLVVSAASDPDSPVLGRIQSSIPRGNP